MKYMRWSWPDYLACPLPIRNRIIHWMDEQHKAQQAAASKGRRR